MVLPASSYAEKSGSFTNSEGCVQKVRAGLEPLGGSRPDWEILSAVSVLMGYPLEYGDAAEILKEIRAVIPGYRVLGATPEPARVDRPAMDRYVGGGFAEDMASRYRATSNITQDSSYPWSLWVGQSLFHSGKLSTMAKGLLEIQKEGRLYMNPADLQRMQLAEGEMVTLTSVAGEARVPVGALGRIPRGILFFPESFKEAIAGLLTMTPDAVTGVPYHKQQRVAVHKT